MESFMTKHSFYKDTICGKNSNYSSYVNKAVIKLNSHAGLTISIKSTSKLNCLLTNSPNALIPPRSVA